MPKLVPMKPLASLDLITMQPQTPKRTGHMEPFRLERRDWKIVFHTLEKAQGEMETADGIRRAWMDVPVAIARKYATREYPSYQMHAFPTSFQATDVVIMDRQNGKILFGQKAKQKEWQFLGGFVDPKDQSLEDACNRERIEESGSQMLCSPAQYLFSARIPDPRYENSPDKTMSAVFLSFYVSGKAKAGDDIKKIRWFNKDYIRRNYKKFVKPFHHGIVEKLIEKGLI